MTDQLNGNDLPRSESSIKPPGLSDEELERLFTRAIKVNDTTGIRTLGHATLLRNDPGVADRVERTEDYGNGSKQQFMADGTIYTSDDGGTTWWLRYSAGSDLWFTGPDDEVGMYD